MIETGVPGTRTSPAEPAPDGTVWLKNVGGYRIGVVLGLRAVVVEPLEYHPGYLLIDGPELARLVADATARQGRS
jgi:hypothetical protein